MVLVACRDKFTAEADGVYPVFRITASTRARGFSPPYPLCLMTRETVALDTPAFLATSSMVIIPKAPFPMWNRFPIFHFEHITFVFLCQPLFFSP